MKVGKIYEQENEEMAKDLSMLKKNKVSFKVYKKKEEGDERMIVCDDVRILKKRMLEKEGFMILRG